MANTNNKRRRRSAAIYAALTLLILATIAGLILVFSPFLDNRDHRIQIEQKIETFKELVAVPVQQPLPAETNADTEHSEPKQEETLAPEKYSLLWLAMQDYNAEILLNGQSELDDAFAFQEAILDLSQYGLEEDSAVGLVVIPEIGVELPLYLGATYDNLANGFAQLSQTSMPIGGTGTNCVIAGHRGWDGMAYMRDVELLEQGDSVYVQNLWETMEYRIAEILLIQPDEHESIFIQEGRDLLTIITCHPYGVGTQRYVLICERYEEEQAPAPTVPTVTPILWRWEWQDRVKVTVSEGLVFEPSQMKIFTLTSLPYLLLAAAAVILLMAAIMMTVRKLKKRKPH